MALVNFLKFSSSAGAVVADEEFWTPRFRRRLHTDSLHSLLDKEMSSAWNMEIAYGGVGYPSVHSEVITLTKKELQKRFNGENSEPAPEQVSDVARIAFKFMQQVIRRRIDQKLLFKYGFNTDDLNRGYFEKDGKKIEIKNESIKEAAQKISTGKDRDSLLKPAMDTRAALFGYDSKYGITGFYLDSDNGILAYNYEGFEAIGTGKYASGMTFGKMFGAKTLSMREAGFEPAEGVLYLIDSALEASYHFKEVGGNMNFVLIDSTPNSHEQRYREIFDRDARLVTEIVKAYKWNELKKEKAVNLINQFLFLNKNWETVNKSLMKSVQNAARFAFLLRNYKKDEVDTFIIPKKAGKK